MKNILYYCDNTNKIDFNFKEKLLPFVTASKKRTLDKFTNYAEIKTRLYPELLTKYVASVYYQKSPFDFEYSYNEFGKPFFSNFPCFNFNISHCKNAFALAISDDKVGVDIEKILQYSPEIAMRFFSKNEIELLNKSLDKNLEFTKIWTLKEAYSKKIGLGLNLPFKSFDVVEPSINQFSKSIIIDGHVISYFSKQELKLYRISEYELVKITKKFINKSCIT